MKFDDIPLEYRNQMPEGMIPSIPHYIITAAGASGVMDDKGGRTVFGEEWEDIVNGEHPSVMCEQLEITLH